MKEKLNRFKLPIALLLILLLGVGVRQGVLLLRDHQAHKARAEAFDAALAQIDPENTAVSFRVPYDSRLFSPQNIGLGQLDGAARDDLLACGGLPAIAEMKDAIESDLQNQINDLGDSAKVDNKLK